DQVVAAGTQLTDDRSRCVRPRRAAQPVKAIRELRSKLEAKRLPDLGRAREERLGSEARRRSLLGVGFGIPVERLACHQTFAATSRTSAAPVPANALPALPAPTFRWRT